MKTARTRISESDARLNARLAIVSTALLLGAVLATLATQSRAAEPFDRGNLTGSIYVGAGRALDRDYTTIGGAVGYMISEGLMLGMSAETWVGNDPDIYKLTPEVRYTFTRAARVKPYIGAFVSHTIYNGLPDANTYGARGDLYAIQLERSVQRRRGVREVIGLRHFNVQRLFAVLSRGRRPVFLLIVFQEKQERAPCRALSP
jgi:hypothetical protein